MIAIIDSHPLRRTMSRRIHKENNPATPMEMEEMTVNARGGLYDMSRTIMLPVIELNANSSKISPPSATVGFNC